MRKAMLFSFTEKEKTWLNTESKGYSQNLRAFANTNNNKEAEAEGKTLERISKKFTPESTDIDLSQKEKAICTLLLVNRINHLVTRILPEYQKNPEQHKDYIVKANDWLKFLTELMEKIHVTDHAYPPEQ